MNLSRTNASVLAVALAAALAAGAGPRGAQDGPLHVCATTSDLGDLVRQIGGEQVRVTVFCKGGEDPHFLEARPSLVKDLSQADLHVQVGLELEVGWAPVLLRQARNAAVATGGPGFLDASTAITPLWDFEGQGDRSMGDVHALGNPHYLLDPICGLKVAMLIRDRLCTLKPAHRPLFERNFQAFRAKLGEALVGVDLARRFDVEKLAELDEHGRLEEFLQRLAREDKLGGWLGLLAPLRGTKVVADHAMWKYFARRFHLNVIDHLEPKPGLAPTIRHLGQVVEKMKAGHVRVILSAAYFPARHAEFVARKSGARVAAMAHQTQSREGCETYLAMIDHNVRQIVAAAKP